MDTNLSTVSNILGIPIDGTWEIADIDEDNNLMLVHGKTSDSRVRGQIIDLSLGKIVCPSFGMVDTVISNHILIKYHPDPTYKEIDMEDEQKKHQIFNLSDVRIENGHEGTILRVWFDTNKGMTRYSTHKRINSKISKWIVTKHFYDMYEELGGPTDLFKEKTFPDQVFFFLIIHPEVQVVSSKDIGKGRLIFLGTSWDQNPQGVDSLPLEIRSYLESTFPREKPLTLEEANAKLKSPGPDYRIDGTDFVVISQGERHIKVVTPGYKWRSRLRDEEPNLTFMWYKAVTHSYQSGRMGLPDEDYLRNYPLLKPIDKTIIKRRLETGQPLSFELLDPSEKPKLNNNFRLHNIFQIYLTSISPSHRLELFKIYQDFFRQRTELSSWIFTLYKNPEDFQKDKVKEKLSLKRIDKILSDVEKFASQRQDQRSNRDPISGQTLNYDQLVWDNIKNLIAKEAGKSLYRLVKTMEQVK